MMNLYGVKILNELFVADRNFSDSELMDSLKANYQSFFNKFGFGDCKVSIYENEIIEYNNEKHVYYSVSFDGGTLIDLANSIIKYYKISGYVENYIKDAQEVGVVQNEEQAVYSIYLKHRQIFKDAGYDFDLLIDNYNII